MKKLAAAASLLAIATFGGVRAQDEKKGLHVTIYMQGLPEPIDMDDVTETSTGRDDKFWRFTSADGAKTMVSVDKLIAYTSEPMTKKKPPEDKSPK